MKIKVRTCEEKITKIKLQMNEHDTSIHVNKNSRIQIVQTDFTTWKYKLDQGATEMFTPEFGNKESLFNVMSEIYKKGDAKKSKSQKVAWIIWDKR